MLPFLYLESISRAYYGPLNLISLESHKKFNYITLIEKFKKPDQ
jgi:hypothetical protein